MGIVGCGEGSAGSDREHSMGNPLLGFPSRCLCYSPGQGEPGLGWVINTWVINTWVLSSPDAAHLHPVHTSAHTGTSAAATGALKPQPNSQVLIPPAGPQKGKSSITGEILGQK